MGLFSRLQKLMQKLFQALSRFDQITMQTITLYWENHPRFPPMNCNVVKNLIMNLYKSFKLLGKDGKVTSGIQIMIFNHLWGLKNAYSQQQDLLVVLQQRNLFQKRLLTGCSKTLQCSNIENFRTSGLRVVFVSHILYLALF